MRRSERVRQMVISTRRFVGDGTHGAWTSARLAGVFVTVLGSRDGTVLAVGILGLAVALMRARLCDNNRLRRIRAQYTSDFGPCATLCS